MSPATRKLIAIIFRVSRQKHLILFWYFIRFLSAILPLVTIYQFSLVIRYLETRQPISSLYWLIAATFTVRILDNFLRLKSITRLEYLISNLTFDIHNYFLGNTHPESKTDRHLVVQAVRNFADSASVTLNLIKQPGIDSLVSILMIPIILYFLNFHAFVITIAYILVYYFIDIYTTQKYRRIKDNHLRKTENYYSQLVDSDDYDLEQTAYTLHFRRLTDWGFTEWFSLQNSAVFFYSIALLYLSQSVLSGAQPLSHLVLVMGYMSQTQVLLNSISQIKDGFTDMFVGLEHLAKHPTIAAIDTTDIY